MQISIDDAARRIIESVSETSSMMLQKVSDDDVSSYQSYTIRRLDQKEPNIPDTDQYKFSNVKEDALSNKLKHLDVMCFPTLFPSGRFGEGHQREVTLSSSKYVKSRLLHKDGRFCKDDQYVFYLLWQKEMGQLAAGV
jgi:ATP-dependent DNA helicase PIF1